VNAEVFCQRRAVGERLLTEPAAVRSFSGVSPEVRGDRGALREATVADWTAERFFTAVRTHVSGEVRCL